MNKNFKKFGTDLLCAVVLATYPIITAYISGKYNIKNANKDDN